MQINVFPDASALADHTAHHIAQLLATKPNALLCLASGSTPVATFRAMSRLQRSGQLDVSQARFVSLDEWVGLGPDDAGSCSHGMNADLYGPLGIRPDQLVAFDAKADDLAAECDRLNRYVADAGGLDLVLLGIGLNGHLALNEPGTPFGTYAHVSDLHPATVSSGQKYFDQPTPLTRGITLGLQHFADAREVLLLATGAAKAQIIHDAVRGPVTEQLPASMLQTHPNAHAWLDADAGALLM